jgi:arylsulfatase A-like enzyme
MNQMKNIIILLIDALRPKNMSLFGYHKETDKNLKEIAKDNILFKQHFSVSNATAPALTSILTAQYPNNHGIIHQIPYTKQEEIDKVEKVKFWLPTFLKSKGYETICIDWFGFWLKKDFDFYDEKDEDQIIEKKFLFISAKDTIDLAISRIKKSKKPFFLFTHFWDTHFPFPNIEYKSNSNLEDREKMLANIKSESQREYLKKRIQNTTLYTIQDMINKYDLAIENIDHEIGKLYNFLKEQNLWEDTIFIVLGDHGDNLTSHEIYFSHAGLYDDSIHVPMIIHLPGFNKQEINEFSQHVDIIPTILDLFEIKIDNNFDGTSLLPLIKNNISIREKIFAYDGLCNDIRAVRTKNRKLIIAKDNFCNLCKASHHQAIEEYDLENDPEETKNIYFGKSELMKFID